MGWIALDKAGKRIKKIPWHWIVIRKAPVRLRALHNLRTKIGTKENPPGSNKCWATAWYGVTGPWCAMAVSWAYSKAGRKLHYDYVPAFLNDAKNKKNGLRVVLHPEPGDVVVYDWNNDKTPDHMGLFSKWIKKGVSFYAIEGNTSTVNDSNGGEVMHRERPVSLVEAFVRVK